MAQIVVEGLGKTFQVAERKKGLWGAVRGLVRRRYRIVHALRDRVTRERRLIFDLAGDAQAVHVPEADVVTQDGGRVTLAFDPERISAADLIARVTQRYAIRDLFVENPPIEEIIARLYNGVDRS